MSRTKKLGILLCGHAPDELMPEHGNYDLMFQRLLGENAFDYSTWAVVDNQLPPDIHAADAWLITGSKHGVYEDHPWIPPLEAFIREAYSADVPMVGICFGHQMLAQALGGKVLKFDGGWSVGRVDYALEGLDEAAHSNTAAIMAYHQDQVVELPPEAQVIGSTDFCRYAALAYGKTALSLQPHPEFDSEFVEGLIRFRGTNLPEEVKTSARASIQEPLAREPVATLLREFLQREDASS